MVSDQIKWQQIVSIYKGESNQLYSCNTNRCLPNSMFPIYFYRTTLENIQSIFMYILHFPSNLIWRNKFDIGTSKRHVSFILILDEEYIQLLYRQTRAIQCKILSSYCPISYHTCYCPILRNMNLPCPTFELWGLKGKLSPKSIFIWFSPQKSNESVLIGGPFSTHSRNYISHTKLQGSAQSLESYF